MGVRLHPQSILLPSPLERGMGVRLHPQCILLPSPSERGMGVRLHPQSILLPSPLERGKGVRLQGVRLIRSTVILAMQRHGIDMIEVGIPFSDPLADGPVIQSAGTVALKNGTTLKKIFAQLKAIKDQVTIPLVMMGYLNVIMHYGLEDFFRSCVESGASGCIIPDLPFKDYMDVVKPIADKYDIRVIMMITPETSEERIRFIDEHTDGFIYMVSSASITGAQSNFGEAKQAYFRHINSMNLHNPRMIGFGISNKQTLESAQQNAAGAIIGSKFVTLLNETKDPDIALNQLFDALKK